MNIGSREVYQKLNLKALRRILKKNNINKIQRITKVCRSNNTDFRL